MFEGQLTRAESGSPVSDLTVLTKLGEQEIAGSIAPIMQELRPAVIRTDHELQALSEEWEQLFQSSGSDNVFLTFHWMLRWRLCMGRGHDLFIVTVREPEGRLAAIAPLYISRQAGVLQIRRLGFLGDSLVGSDYLDIVVDKAKRTAVLQCLADFIISNKKEWDYIDLADTLSQSNAAGLCENLVQRRMRADIETSSVCPYIVLPASAEAYLNSLGARTRKRLRYHLRSLEREGKVDFTIARSGADLEHAYERLLDLHRTRLRTQGRESAFVEPRVNVFHRAVLGALASEGRARIYLLTLDGEPISALYALSAGSRMFFYQSGMDPNYGRFSVGSLLIQYAIEDAIRGQLSEFDFLRGDEPYKLSWTSQQRQMRCIRLFDNRLKSRATHAKQIVKKSLKTCKALLIPPAPRPRPAEQ
jgi:CelD/BcsL family acetyltransferase involved in cellulose biosynthesis